MNIQGVLPIQQHQPVQQINSVQYQVAAVPPQENGVAASPATPAQLPTQTQQQQQQPIGANGVPQQQVVQTPEMAATWQQYYQQYYAQYYNYYWQQQAAAQAAAAAAAQFAARQQPHQQQTPQQQMPAQLVRPHHAFQNGQQPHHQQGTPAPNAQGLWSLFVYHLPQNTTDQTLKELFGRYGTVVEVVIMRENPQDPTSKNRGFGFVNYHDYQEAAAAVEGLNGFRLENKRLQVSFKTPRKGGGGGGGGGGGHHHNNQQQHVAHTPQPQHQLQHQLQHQHQQQHNSTRNPNHPPQVVPVGVAAVPQQVVMYPQAPQQPVTMGAPTMPTTVSQ